MYYPLEDPTIQQSEIAQERINWERKLESAKTFARFGEIHNLSADEYQSVPGGGQNRSPCGPLES